MMAAAACLGLAVAASAAFYFFGAGESTPPSPEPAIPVPSEVIRPLGVTGGDALSHLKRQFNEIDDNIRIMRSEGKSREADAAKQRLDEFKAMLQGPYPAPATKGPEIQMVGVYEGFGTLPGFQSQSINGKVNVLVTYKSNPVVLVLTAYEPVTWNLSLAPGVRIEKIVMISYYKCKIEGAPPGVPVVSSSYEGGEHGFHFEHGGSTPYSWGSGEHKSFSESLKKSLGELVVMEGDYNPGKDKRFELGPESLDWRAQHILWRMQSFYDEMTAGRKRDLKTVLSKLRFYGSWGDDYSLTLGELSPFETPKAMVTAREPVEGSATFDKDRNTWYVCATHNLYKVAADGTVTNLVPPDTLPRLSWLSGTAYDERRKKIYVVSYHVDNCVYSFDPGTGKWDVKPITDMRGWGLAYSKSDDSLYTLEELEDNRYSLVRMTVNGEVLSRFPLSEPLSDMRQRCPVVLQLADAGDYIFAVLSPHNSPEEEGAITYVIEKSSGKIVLTTQAKPRPKR